MKKLRTVGILAVLIFLVGIMACFKVINETLNDEVDIITLNSIAKEAAKEWKELDRLKEKHFVYDYIIFDNKGKMLFYSGNQKDYTVEQAIKDRQSYIDIIENGKVLGTVVAFTNDGKSMTRQRQQIGNILVLTGGFEAILLMIYLIKLNHQILKPFEKLKRFAEEVSRGNLDLPLEMDEKNAFGEFTESFDMMREELKLSKKKEYEANESKKELIASLSHDIKTPVTGIKLLSELLQLQIEQPELKEKVSTIYNKAEQINDLITDMFEVTLEELNELKVKPKDEYANCLTEFFKRMDYEGHIRLGKIPDCMIYIDSIRMEQIINNIISNSYKYAGTPIDVSFTLITGYLQVKIKDYGEGVSPEELPLIFNKFYRSKKENVQKKAGAGLGLYIAKNLMEKIGGEMSCSNEEDGFMVKLLIPLSSRDFIE